MHTRDRIALETLVVGPGECEIATDGRLVTRRLQSCVVVAAHIPRLGLAAMLRISLPDSAMDPVLASREPCLFADTGVPVLLERIAQYGGKPEEARVWAMGAAPAGAGALSSVAKQNELAVQQAIAKARLTLAGEDFGGNSSRSVWLESLGGRLIVSAEYRDPGQKKASVVKSEAAAIAGSQRLLG